MEIQTTDNNLTVTPMPADSADSDITASESVEPVEIKIDGPERRESRVDRVLTAAAHLLSLLFNPLLVPTYGMLLVFTATAMRYVNAEAKWLTVLVTLALTGMVPLLVIFLLYKMGMVKNPGLNDRRERVIPYAVAFVAYGGCAGYLYSVNAPDWIWLFIVGGGVALLAVAIVNIWWKISAHAAAMGGLVGLGFFILIYRQALTDFTPWVLALVILAGMVCTSRLILRRHTHWQVAAGFLVGLVSVLGFASIHIPEMIE